MKKKWDNWAGNKKLVEGASLFPYSEEEYAFAYKELMGKLPPLPYASDSEAGIQFNYTGRKKVDKECLDSMVPSSLRSVATKRGKRKPKES